MAEGVKIMDFSFAIQISDTNLRNLLSRMGVEWYGV